MRDFQLRVLVCTDLLARGVDFGRVSLVIQLALPRDLSTYLHRVGRTGRFGARGLAVLILWEHEVSRAQAMLAPLAASVRSLPHAMLRPGCKEEEAWYLDEMFEGDAGVEQLQRLEEIRIGTQPKPAIRQARVEDESRCEQEEAEEADAAEGAKEVEEVEEEEEDEEEAPTELELEAEETVEEEEDGEEAASSEELRIDPADGNAYSLAEFIAEYGGTEEWTLARTVGSNSARGGSVPPAMMSAGSGREACGLARARAHGAGAMEQRASVAPVDGWWVNGTSPDGEGDGSGWSCEGSGCMASQMVGACTSAGQSRGTLLKPPSRAPPETAYPVPLAPPPVVPAPKPPPGPRVAEALQPGVGGNDMTAAQLEAARERGRLRGIEEARRKAWQRWGLL